MTAPRTLSTCWVVTDGKAGAENQCLGLSEALGLSPAVKRVALRTPWRQLSPYFRFGHARAFTPDSDTLTPPWPDLLLASGRQSIAAALYVRAQSRRAGTPTITVFVQNPGISASHFDLVIAPEHDRVKGANVVSTRGALHRITRAKLEEGRAKLAPRVAHLPPPYIGVLIGGANAYFDFNKAEITRLSKALLRVVGDMGGSLLITPSRRTGEGNLAILKSALADTPSFLWDGTGENPYLGLLGLADHLVVTSDSVGMVTDALATGKPVHVFMLPGRSRKFARFYGGLFGHRLIRPFDGRLEYYNPTAAQDDMARAADAIRSIFAGTG